MARDLSAYLQDVLEACNSIEYVMSGVSLDEYRSKRAVRSAVEREFIIIGEALRRVSALDEGLFSSISNSRETFLVPAWAHCGLVMASVGRIEDRLQPLSALMTEPDVVYIFPRLELAFNAPEWRIFHHYRREKGWPGRATRFPAKIPAMAPISATERPLKRDSLSCRAHSARP